jgi:hypothetical protein
LIDCIVGSSSLEMHGVGFKGSRLSFFDCPSLSWLTRVFYGDCGSRKSSMGYTKPIVETTAGSYFGRRISKPAPWGFILLEISTRKVEESRSSIGLKPLLSPCSRTLKGWKYLSPGPSIESTLCSLTVEHSPAKFNTLRIT